MSIDYHQQIFHVVTLSHRLFLFLGDLDLNSEVLTWPQRINPVFDQNEELVEASKVTGEKSMLEKKEKVGKRSYLPSWSCLFLLKIYTSWYSSCC